MLRGPIRFTNALAGTVDFIYPGPAIDMQSPAAAGAASGATYVYYAQSLDMSEWEIGSGAYTSGSGTFARTTITANSLGTTAKINFTNPPQVLVLDTAAAFLTQTQAVQRNRIINGGMMVSQENGAAAGTTNNYYPVDQFRTVISGTSGAVSVAQVASATPGGSPNRIRCTVTTADAAVASTDIVVLLTKIDGTRVADLLIGSASAKTITISFGVKAPAGTYCVTFQNNDATRSYVAEVTIAAGEANADTIKPITLPLDQTGTWIKDTTGSGLTVIWGLMVGSSFAKAAGAWGTDGASGVYGSSNQFNFMGTNGNVFELFDVGLYEGAVAPAFQLPDFATELQLCKRYWQKSYAYNIAVGTVTPNGIEIVVGYGAATNTVEKGLRWPVSMRASPTLTVYSHSTGAAGKVVDVSTGGDVAATIDLSTDTSARIVATVSSASNTQGFFAQWKADARI